MKRRKEGRTGREDRKRGWKGCPKGGTEKEEGKDGREDGRGGREGEND